MDCPFPGMDPYIERPAIWADFHDRLIPAISATLQPMLRPKYAALVQDRLYVVESRRPIRPDVGRRRDRCASAYRHAWNCIAGTRRRIVYELCRRNPRAIRRIVEARCRESVDHAIEVQQCSSRRGGTLKRTGLDDGHVRAYRPSRIDDVRTVLDQRRIFRPQHRLQCGADGGDQAIVKVGPNRWALDVWIHSGKRTVHFELALGIRDVRSSSPHAP